MAGEFEIDRVGQRNPEDFPRPAIAEVSEPVMPEEDPAIAEEEELDEEDEIIEAAEASTPEPQSPHERNEPVRESGRRRRRRGGRNRGGRERHNDGPREQALPHDGIPVIEGGEVLSTAHLIGATEEDLAQPTSHEARPEVGFTNTQGEGAPRRRRRRRRGRRGGNRDQFAQPPNAPTSEAPLHSSSLQDRFGPVSDEVDTTPSETPGLAPNASSTPSWTLDEPADIDTTPGENDKPAAPAKRLPPQRQLDERKRRLTRPLGRASRNLPVGLLDGQRAIHVHVPHACRTPLSDPVG